MREDSTGKILAMCLVVAVLFGVAFASTSDAIDASKLGATANLSNAASLESRSVGVVADFDPFDLPLVIPEPSTPVINITSGVDAARWAEHVTVTVTSGQFRFESNGLPNHELPNPFLALQGRSYSPAVEWSNFTELDRTAEVVASPIDQIITLNPVLADAPAEAPAGLIGVLINGAQLYNDGDVIDQVLPDSYDVGFVDICNGHPIGVEANGSGAGSYHYHAVPSCTTDGIDVEGQHSSILGVMIDGFPVYGSNDLDGVAVRGFNLDECSGHFGSTPEFPDGIYHYHLLDEVSPDPIPCLVGEFDNPDAPVESGLDIRTRSRE